jgi:hypothetical protein
MFGFHVECGRLKLPTRRDNIFFASVWNVVFWNDYGRRMDARRSRVGRSICFVALRGLEATTMCVFFVRKQRTVYGRGADVVEQVATTTATNNNNNNNIYMRYIRSATNAMSTSPIR